MNLYLRSRKDGEMMLLKTYSRGSNITDMYRCFEDVCDPPFSVDDDNDKFVEVTTEDLARMRSDTKALLEMSKRSDERNRDVAQKTGQNLADALAKAVSAMDNATMRQNIIREFREEMDQMNFESHGSCDDGDETMKLEETIAELNMIEDLIVCFEDYTFLAFDGVYVTRT